MARTSRQRLVSRAAPAHVFAGVEYLRLGWELTSIPGSEHRGARPQPVCRPRRDIPWTPMSQGCVPGVRMVNAALNLWKTVLTALFQGAPLARVRSSTTGWCKHRRGHRSTSVCARHSRACAIGHGERRSMAAIAWTSVTASSGLAPGECAVSWSLILSLPSVALPVSNIDGAHRASRRKDWRTRGTRRRCEERRRMRFTAHGAGVSILAPVYIALPGLGR